jgi:talin
LIAGYIDIILKKKKDSDRPVEDEEEEVAISEENVRPAKATAINIMANRPGHAMEVNVATAGFVAEDQSGLNAKHTLHKKNFLRGDMMQLAKNEGGGQQALLQNINSGFASINAATSDLSVATQLPPLGKKKRHSRDRIWVTLLAHFSNTTYLFRT